MDAASNKRVRVGVASAAVPVSPVRKRQAFADVNSRQDAAAGADAASLEGLENATVEFTKEEVEQLLNYKPKIKELDHEANAELMSEDNKRLRLCIKWFQTVEETHLIEQRVLRSALDSAEKKCIETEIQMAKRLEQLDGVIAGLRNDNLSLQEQLAKESSEKQEAINCHLREMERRIAVEKLQANLLEDLEKCKQEFLAVARKALEDEAIRQKESFAVEVKFLRETLQQVREDRDNQKTLVQPISAIELKSQESARKLLLQLDKLMIKFDALKETHSCQTEQIRILQYQVTSANEKLKMADMSAAETMVQHEEKDKIIHELHDRLASMETRVIEGEVLRKKLHNIILELKGNIRVFCRVCPLMPDDSAGSDTVISYPTSTEALGRGIELLQSGAQKYSFTFDKVFSHDDSQESVFVEISQLVQSALDGYKVCIFAYGQTRSGKTYTMMGKPDAPEQKGLIPRSLEQIFQANQALASMLEIYNETIRDLLVPNKASGLEIFHSENRNKYTIKHDANGNTYVSDLTIVDVCSIKKIYLLLEQAAQNRSVGKTNMNAQSSRSHFVFTLRICGVNENTKQQVQGVLNLIDLAGSERLSRSDATGDRLKETQAINKSLSSLGDVIFALAEEEGHVPFRNSKLTYLLQPYLGGDSKTLMFVNISPDPSSVDESLCSLRFAARVNTCEIGVPRR